MKHGDISNQYGYIIGFRCEDSLIEYKDKNMVDKVLNTIIGKEKRMDVNKEVLSAMEYLYYHTEYCVDLVVSQEKYTAKLREVLDSYPFNRILVVQKDTEIYHRLLSGDLSLYVDEKEERRHSIQNPYAISLKELYNLVKMRGN